jgi:hypothetical protein
MRKLILSAVSAATFAVLSASPAAATVTFDFWWTGDADCRSACGPPAPIKTPLAFTVSSPTESGSASWGEDGRGSYPLPVVTDPAFALQGPGVGIDGGVEPPNFGYDPTCWIEEVCTFYSVAWTAVDGVLTALYLKIDDASSDLQFGLTGGWALTDDLDFAGGGGCCIEGYWQAALPGGGSAPVPEPGSMPLLLTALFGLAFVRSRRQPAPRPRAAEIPAGS